MSNDLYIRQVSKTFQHAGNPVTAIKDINLEIEAGSFVCIIGGSGCGKSTLLRILAGLENSTSGTARLGDKLIAGPGQDRGVVFQEHRLMPWLTVQENIALGLRELSADERRQRVEDHIKLVGLVGFENAYPHQISGGMAQRVAIARALVKKPKVLLLDEPFGALDALTRMRMQDEILQIWQKEKTTMVLVTHDINEAVYLGDKVVVISDRPGTIRSIVPVKMSRPRNRTSPEFAEFSRKVFEDVFVDEAQLDAA